MHLVRTVAPAQRQDKRERDQGKETHSDAHPEVHLRCFFVNVYQRLPTAIFIETHASGDRVRHRKTKGRLATIEQQIDQLVRRLGLVRLIAGTVLHRLAIDVNS